MSTHSAFAPDEPIPEPDSSPTEPPADVLLEWLADARARTVRLVSDLSPEQLFGPRQPTLNPPLWEVGHVAWFEERWVLRHARGEPGSLHGVDQLYPSDRVPQDARWDLPLPDLEATLEYLQRTHARVAELLDRGEPSARERYFLLLALFHEDMHTEALVTARQLLGYAQPPAAPPSPRPSAAEGSQDPDPPSGDLELPGGRFHLGAAPETPFVFDNEKWRHPLEVRPFAIARRPVTEGELRAFVDDEGYGREDLWSPEGWRWRREAHADRPLYWRRDGSDWHVREFDRWRPLAPASTALHVNWFEADAYCRWAGRRLPTEVEWELTALAAPSPRGGLAPGLRPNHWRTALEPGSACGPLGPVGSGWEWTASWLEPYPGFRADPYVEYSRPWFGTHRVLRGGGPHTAPRMLRPTFRNFYEPHRRDPYAGFRTCAP